MPGIFSTMLKNMTSLFICMGVGYLFRKIKMIDDAVSAGLSRILLYVAVPCTCFVSMMREFSYSLLGESVVTLLSAFAIYLFGTLLGAVFTRITKSGARQGSVWKFALTFPNVGYAGFPIMTAVYGQTGLIYTAMMNAAFNALAFSLGIWLYGGAGDGVGAKNGEKDGSRHSGAGAKSGEKDGSRGWTGAKSGEKDGFRHSGVGAKRGEKDGSRRGWIGAKSGEKDASSGGEADAKSSEKEDSRRDRAGAKSGENYGSRRGGPGANPRRFETARRILLNPAMVATIAGFACFALSLRPPEVIGNSLTFMSNLTTPLSMIIVGAILAKTDMRKAFTDIKVYFVSLLRLAVIPLAAFAVTRLFIANPVALGVTTYLAAMPVASLTVIMAEERGGDSETASKVVLVSTLLSIVSIPLISIVV